jgi:hypothetical protein
VGIGVEIEWKTPFFPKQRRADNPQRNVSSSFFLIDNDVQASHVLILVSLL